jgi:hypothetical protein
MGDRRRGRRVNSHVPIVLEWEGEGGQTFRQEAHTRMVSPYGCLVVIPQNLELDQRIQLTNLDAQKSIAAVVVWKGSERAEGWELGIEMEHPEMDFWGLDL